MPIFKVQDGFGPGVVGVKVVVRKKVDNTIAFNGVTNASGEVDIVGLIDDVDYVALVYKVGYHRGVRFTFKQKPVLALRPTVILLAPQAPPPPPPPMNQLNLLVLTGAGVPLIGAEYIIRDIVQVLNQGFVDGSGRVSIALGADITGYTLSVRLTGMDGIIFPLDHCELSGDFVVTLGPTIAADE